LLCKNAAAGDVNKAVMQVITEMTNLKHSNTRLFVKLKGLGKSFAATFAHIHWLRPHQLLGASKCEVTT
jgi:hypothetical protein